MSGYGQRSRLGSYLKRKAAQRLIRRVGMAKLAAAGAVMGLVFLFGLAILAALVGAGASAPTAKAAATCRVAGSSESPPRSLQPIYQAAAEQYGLGPRGPSVLAAINEIETGFGANLNVSSAGAMGWMQFIPSTWAAYGVDADEDGVRDPYDPADAIFAAANYLRASGAPADWYQAIFAYNHADWYVEEVEALAEEFSGPLVCTPAAGQVDGGDALLQSAGTLYAPRAFKAIPARLWVGGGSPQAVDSRIWLDVVWVLEAFDLRVTAAREAGHQTHGDGTAIDLVPGPGRGWDETARQAAEVLGWREGCGASGSAPTCPLVPAIQFVAYNGYAGHGDPAHAGGNAHLHISWQSSSFGCAELCPPPHWVQAFPLAA